MTSIKKKDKAIKEPSFIERAAIELAGAQYRGRYRFRDTGEIEKQHDWDVTCGTYVAAAVEVTSVQDKDRRSLDSALARHWGNRPLSQPELSRRWFVSPTPNGPSVKKIRGELIALLSKLEKLGVAELHLDSWFWSPNPLDAEQLAPLEKLVQEMVRLGFDWLSSEPANGIGQVIPAPSISGISHVDSRHLLDLVQALVADPQDHDLLKVASSGAENGHLVVFVAAIGDVDFKGTTINCYGVNRALRTRQLPTANICLPAGLTDLWICPLDEGGTSAAHYNHVEAWTLADATPAWRFANNSSRQGGHWE